MSDDFGDTDLALEGSFSEHGSQEIAPEEAVAPTDAAGNIIGRVAVKKEEGLRLPDNKRLSAEDQRCEYALQLVGKVLCLLIFSCLLFFSLLFFSAILPFFWFVYARFFGRSTRSMRAPVRMTNATLVLASRSPPLSWSPVSRCVAAHALPMMAETSPSRRST